VTLSGQSLYNNDHLVQVAIGGNEQTATWSGNTPWSESFQFPAFAGSATITLLTAPAVADDRVHFDSMQWEVPVQLNLNGQGAEFFGRSGRWRYQFSNPPAGATLYAVDDPTRPVILNGAGNGFEVEGNGGEHYVLAGPGTLHTPAIEAYTPTTIAQPRSATAVYIAPAAFSEALAPLVAHRQNQGHTVAVVTVEAIYAGWSHGQVDPDAIRDFLRYAAATWPVPPQSVTLVGDGTADPRNYLERNNTNWIPPYMARVDPWLGEASCETCYGQLDGASPLDDSLPDLEIGRLPVKSADELAGVIAKIIAYETSPELGAWRGRLVYVADNADLAGDFAAASDASIAMS
jgi:hypothetical protein